MAKIKKNKPIPKPKDRRPPKKDVTYISKEVTGNNKLYYKEEEKHEK